MQVEGVIRFALRFTYASPCTPESFASLNAWRSRLWRLQLIGRRAGRYDGLGYGNVSCRIKSLSASSRHSQFIVSGSQTGELAELDARHYCVVTGWDVQLNSVIAQGPIRPSSESLTHGMLYDLDDDVRVVFHVHSPAIWRASSRIGLHLTDPGVAYGTPDMACEVARLFRETDVKQAGIFAMGGHEDGVIAFGADADAAGTVLMEALERGRQK